MYVITVIPIKRGVFKDELSYFTRDAVALGTLIKVPLRAQIVHALVVAIEDVREQKSKLKTQSFTLKKIATRESNLICQAAFIRACELTARYFAQPIAQILAVQIPRLVLTHASKLTAPQPPPLAQAQPQVLVLQETESERVRLLKRHIQERFAKGESVLLIEPTIADIESLQPLLEKGVPKSTLVLHGGKSKAEVLQNWRAAIGHSEPILVIATAYFFSLPIARLGCIIIDHEHSSAYRTIGRPAFDQRVFARLYTLGAGLDLIYADRLLSIETLRAYDSESYRALSPLNFQTKNAAPVRIIDLRPPAITQKPVAFRVIGQELQQAVALTQETHSQLFLYCQRKGLASLTYCEDCQSIVTCPGCDTPLVLQTNEQTERFFRCTHCGSKKKAGDQCSACGSWRLGMLGIGLERVRQEIKRLFPRTPIFELHADRIRSHPAAKKCLRDFLDTPGALLLGNEMALHYLHKPVARIGVVSFDSLFSVPNFRVPEKIMRILMQLRDLAEDQLLIQTRKADDLTLSYFKRDQVAEWYKAEIKERAQFNYPPSSVLVKISTPSSTAGAAEVLRELQEQKYAAQITLYHTKGSKGPSVRLNLLMRFRAHTWPHPETIAYLRCLPPAYTIQVDPENLL